MILDVTFISRDRFVIDFRKSLEYAAAYLVSQEELTHQPAMRISIPGSKELRRRFERHLRHGDLVEARAVYNQMYQFFPEIADNVIDSLIKAERRITGEIDLYLIAEEMED